MSKSANRPLSRTAIESMTEEELRLTVVIPLFKAMGYRDVLDYHGGILEQGKDVVMWEQTPLGRRNIGVVVKAAKLSGKASGGGSASEVWAQIAECFGRRFVDASTPTEQVVHECIVVCPLEIKKEARLSLDSLLANHPSRDHVRYVHGDGLWDLVSQHLGARTALAQLHEVGGVLDSLSSNYRLVATTRGTEVGVTVEPKHERATSEEPLTFKAAFVFPDDQAGAHAREEFLLGIRTGTPFKVPAEYIEELELPHIVRQVCGDEIRDVRMASSPRETSLRLTLKVTSANGETVALADLDFQCVRAGTEEATFVAARGATEVTLVVLQQGGGKVSIRTSTTGRNVVEAFAAVRLLRLTNEGGAVVIEDSSTGFPIIAMSLSDGGRQERLRWFETFLSELIEVQRATGTAIQLPTRPPNAAEVRHARCVAQAIGTGVASVEIGSLGVHMGRKWAEQIAETPKSALFRLAVPSSGNVKVFDVDLNVGAVVIVVDGARVDDGNLQLVIEALAREAADEISVVFDCTAARCIALHLDYLSSEEFERYRLMFPGLSSARPPC